MRLHLLLAAGVLALPLPALAQGVVTAPPPAPYQPVSELVPLPDFLPGSASSSSILRPCRPGRFSPTTTTARWSAPST